MINRKPYQKLPISKQTKKKKRKLTKKIVMTEENVVKSFLNECYHFYAPASS